MSQRLLAGVAVVLLALILISRLGNDEPAPSTPPPVTTAVTPVAGGEAARAPLTAQVTRQPSPFDPVWYV